MNDLVKRLRFNSTAGVPDFTNSKLLEEAADRIEELEAEIERLQAAKRRALALADEHGKELAALRLAPEQMPLTVNTIDLTNPLPGDPPVQQQPNSAVFPGFRGNNEA